MHSTNLVGIPTGLLASTAFNAHPLPLSISGAREMNPGLFRLLDTTPDLAEAAQVFRHYMEMLFELRPAADDGRPRRFRSSYLKLLEGWGFDSNSAQGAVLKGWVESRFGLLPNYHKSILGRYPSNAWMHYIEEKMGSRFHNNSINLQLDLLYEYCQWALTRFWRAGQRHVTLFRGVNCWEEVDKIAAAPYRPLHHAAQQPGVVQLRARADEFGDWILEAQVPLVKILYNDLLSRHTRSRARPNAR